MNLTPNYQDTLKNLDYLIEELDFKQYSYQENPMFKPWQKQCPALSHFAKKDLDAGVVKVIAEYFEQNIAKLAEKDRDLNEILNDGTSLVERIWRMRDYVKSTSALKLKSFEKQLDVKLDLIHHYIQHLYYFTHEQSE